MVQRSKLYYPDSQIQKGLYTNGQEWMLQDGQEYVGAYHRYADGLIMSGGYYNENTSQILIPYVAVEHNQNNVAYDAITRLNVRSFASPRQIRVIPTDKDYNDGFYVRYFIAKRNDVNAPIVEVDSAQFKSLNRPNTGINESLYYGISLRWKLTGPLTNVTDHGKVIEYGVQDVNRATLISKQADMPGILKYLGDLIEYSVHSKLYRSSTRNER